MQHYQRIRDLREDADLSQQKLSEKLKMHKTTYVNYESGKRNIPFELAVTLAEFYQVSLDYLAGRTNIKEKFVSDRVKKQHLQENISKKEKFQTDLFTYDELQLLEHYRTLTERNKGRVEQLIDMLLENQKS